MAGRPRGKKSNYHNSHAKPQARRSDGTFLLQSKTDDESLIRWMEVYAKGHGNITKSVIIRLALEHFRQKQDSLNHPARSLKIAGDDVIPAPFDPALDTPDF